MSPDETFVAELLRALASAGLEAIIVGSVAAVLQGAPVTTRDVDILLRDTPRNRAKLEAFYALVRGRPLRPSPRSEAITVVGTAIPIDILFDRIAGGLRFESLRSRAVRVRLGAHEASAASLADVIASKEAADRPKDRAQLPALRDTLRVLKVLSTLESAGES